MPSEKRGRRVLLPGANEWVLFCLKIRNDKEGLSKKVFYSGTTAYSREEGTTSGYS